MSEPKLLYSDEPQEESFRIVETPPSSVNTPILTKRRAASHIPLTLHVGHEEGGDCLSPTSNCSGLASDSAIPNYKSPPPLPLPQESDGVSPIMACRNRPDASHLDEGPISGTTYPTSILKRSTVAKGSGLSPNSSFFAQRVPSDLTNSFNLNPGGCNLSNLSTANGADARLRTTSTLATNTFEDSCEFNIHRVSSAVRFQLPEDPSSPVSIPFLASPSQPEPACATTFANGSGMRDSNASTNTTNSTTRTSSHTSNDTNASKGGPLGMIFSLFKSPQKQSNAEKEAPQATSFKEDSNGPTCNSVELSDQMQTCKLQQPEPRDENITVHSSKALETEVTFQSFVTDDYDSDKSKACIPPSNKGQSSVSYGSPKRFDGSASPTGSFYFDGNHQVYIPDAPEDIMDIPSNQSFVGGGSFCSSPVVFSKKLKTVDVGQNLQVLNDAYVVYMDKLIGSGSFGEVYLCYSIEEEVYYAVKILNRKRLERMGIGTGNNAMEKLLNEIAIMQKLRHENIIALKEVINDSAANMVYLILELAGYGPLLNLQDGFVEPDCEGNCKINEATVQDLVHSMVQALVYAHGEGVAHRDIKPDNVLLTNDSQLKVSDFGVSCLVDKQRTLDREGSIAFLPPEMLLPITKEKFIAPSPHVSAMAAGFTDALDDDGVFGRLVPDTFSRVDSRGYQAMAPLSVDAGGSFSATSHPTFAAAFSSASNNPHSNMEFRVFPPDACLFTPEARPISGNSQVHDNAFTITVPNKIISPTVPNEAVGTPNHHEMLSPSSPAPTHRMRARSEICTTRDDSFSSPHSASLVRSPKVGWRHVNRNEIDLFKADVWALGVTAFVMLHGRLPWLAHLDLHHEAPSDVALEEENNISDRLDPQSRYRLSLYQKWKARKGNLSGEEGSPREDTFSQSYLSPYRMKNSSFAKSKSELPPFTSVSNDDIFCSIATNPPKEDKQNVEFAFWKYWTGLVHDSHLGIHSPSAATEKQLQAILSNPDPVTLLHSSCRRVSNDPHGTWDVFASSDDEEGPMDAPIQPKESPFYTSQPSVESSGEPIIALAPLNISDRQSPQLGSDGSTNSGVFGRGRARSMKVSDDVDLYLAKQKLRFGGHLGKCDSCTDAANSFIRECLQLDPVVRPTMSELLQHPWLASAKEAFEAKQKTVEGVFSGIPMVNETVSYNAQGASPLVFPSTNVNDTPLKTSPTTRTVPTQSSARPIALEERASLPTKLPELLSSGQLAFRGLQPRRAVDDSVLVQVRKWHVEGRAKMPRTDWFSQKEIISSSLKIVPGELDSVAGSSRVFEPKKNGLRRPMSVPARIDEIDSFCLEGEPTSGASKPVISRKRTMTQAPVFQNGKGSALGED